MSELKLPMKGVKTVELKMSDKKVSKLKLSKLMVSEHWDAPPQDLEGPGLQHPTFGLEKNPKKSYSLIFGLLTPPPHTHTFQIKWW